MTSVLSPEQRLAALKRVEVLKRYQWDCGVPGCDGRPHPGDVMTAMPIPHARATQLPPAGDWYAWFMMSGRGFGKTRSGAEYVKERMMGEPGHRVACIVPDFGDGRDLCIEGESGLIPGGSMEDSRFPPGVLKTWNRSLGEIVLHNGSRLKIFGTNTRKDAEGLRGFQCFVAGTMVRTEHGERAIESIKVGDRVWTHAGLRRVYQTSERAAPEVVSVSVAGRRLVGTPNHPVWTENRGWIALSSLHADDTVITWSDESPGTRTTEGAGSGTAMTESSRPSLDTAGCGSRPTVHYLTDGMSTISTVTEATMSSATCSPYLELNTCSCTPGSHDLSNARTAEWCSTTQVGASDRCAAHHVSAQPSERNDGAPMSSEASEQSYAQSAVPLSEHVQAHCAQCDASTCGATSIGAARVFNLAVEGLPEYFANDVLVHNCHTAWFEELGTQQFGEVAWAMLQFALRLGDDPRVVITGTPRPTKLIRELVEDDGVIVTGGTTYDNAANLPPVMLNRLKKKYEGTNLGNQELHGLLLDGAKGALWTYSMFRRDFTVPHLVRVVVAVDPAGTAKRTSDLTGIVVAGLDAAGQIWVLADKSGRYSPEEWRTVVSHAHRDFDADYVVGEQNYGGDMVRATIRGGPEGEQMRFKPVHASRGKEIRATPVLGLYEQQRVVHVGTFADLEQQMTSWVPPGQFDEEGDPIEPSAESPDRLDALCWACTELAGLSAKRKPRTTMHFTT